MSSFLILILASSCDDFLSDPPDNRTTLDTPQKVSQLLTNAYSGAQHALFTEIMTDNADDKGPAASAYDEEITRRAYQWQDISVSDRDTPDYYWEKGYEAIAHANQALEAIQRLGGGATLDPMKGEALLTRAYAHFMLLNIFSPHYDPKTAGTELGVPYVISPEKNAIRQYQRATVQQTYDSIEKDMNEGLLLIKEDYKNPKFHFTPVAAHAFATRLYLWKGGSSKVHWKRVVEHANKVLGSGAPSSSLVRDQNSASHRRLTYDQKAIAYSSSQTPTNLLITWGASAFARKFDRGRYGLSDRKYIELIEGTESTTFGGRANNTVGHPFGKSWSYTKYFSLQGLHNLHAKFHEYFKVINPSAGTGRIYVAIIHLSTDEVLLSRSEAYVMLGEFEKASAGINVFLSRKTRIDTDEEGVKSFDPATDRMDLALMKEKHPVIAGEYTPYYPLTPSQASFVKGIAELRRREFIQEGMRWFDIKRFHLMVKHPMVEKDTLKLEKNDLRKAVQVPQYVQAWGIKPNPR